jgi:hypothetical protein
LSPALLRRQAALAAIALVAGLTVYGLAHRDAGGGTEQAIQPVEGAAPVEQAIVGVYGGTGRDAGCGLPIEPTVLGVVHPVLPCGAKLVVSHEGRSVQTEVVGRDRVGAARHFDLTAALASRIGIGPEGGTVRWRFAG